MVVNRYLDAQSIASLKERNLLREFVDLRIRYIPSAPRSDVGWVGYETPTKDGRMRSTLDNGKFTIHTNAVYINECFVRFPSRYPSYKGKRAYPVFIVAHVPEKKEELIYFPASGRVGGAITKMFTDRGVTEDTVHEYVVRIFRRGRSGKGIWNVEIFYHDSDLAPISDGCVDTARGEVLERFTPNEPNWKVAIPYDPKLHEVWQDPMVAKTVNFVKDVLIPMHPHTPTEEDYLSWFQHFGQLSEEQAQTMYEHRMQVRLA